MTYLRIMSGCVIVGSLLLHTGEAQSQDRPPTVFFDDFAGAPDGSAGWYSNPTGSGQRSEGRLVLTAPTGMGFAESGAENVVLDAPIQSITTQARYEGAADGGLWLWLRGGGYGSFGCGIGQGAWDGLYCNRDDRGLNPPSVILELVPTDLDITQDTMLRLDVSNILIGDTEGTRLEFWAWQGDTMPVNPQITFDDPHRLVPPKGCPGLYVGSPTAESATGTFGFMDVAADILPGDFDQNRLLDAKDIDSLSREARRLYAAPRLWLFDLNHDGSVDQLDIGVWVHELKNGWYGDADLNGEFNSDDMVQVFQGGEYEIGWVEPSGYIHNQAGWAEGDWNGDGLFTSDDIVIAFQDGGYEQGSRTDLAAVPEPAAWTLLVIGLPLWLFGRRTCAI